MPVPGSNIRLLREKVPLSVRALAGLVGMSHGNLSRLERGEGGYSHEVLQRIADVLKVSVGTLFQETLDVQMLGIEMRHVPFIGRAAVVAWRGRDAYDEVPNQEYQLVSFDRASGNSFAIRVADDALAPHLNAGDELVIDGNKQPKFGQIVLAVDAEQQIHIGRIRLPHAAALEDAAMFEILPFDNLASVVSMKNTRGLELRGTMAERRTYQF